MLAQLVFCLFCLRQNDKFAHFVHQCALIPISLFLQTPAILVLVGSSIMALPIFCAVQLGFFFSISRFCWWLRQASVGDYIFLGFRFRWGCLNRFAIRTDHVGFRSFFLNLK